MTSNCDKGVFEVEDLISYFKNHACCKGNCVVNVCGLPDNSGNYCGSCYPKQSFCCVSKSSNHEHSSETKQKKKFYDFVEANRAGWSRYYKNKNDTRSVESEKKSQLFKELKVYLLNKSEEVNGNWKWDNSYKLRLDNGDEFPVCRMAWCSVMGISIHLIERTQRNIRESNGKSAFVGSRDGVDDVIDAKQSFFHFGIDIEGAHSYIGSLISMDEVPDTEGALVLVCWLSSYFDLIGEEQPGANVIHYDPILLRDIWEQYAVSF